MENDRKILFIGYGNPGRQDDGLGQAFIRRFSQDQSIASTSVEFVSCYQLAVEHADRMQGFDCVVFVDAHVNLASPFELLPIAANENDGGFGSHSISPESLLALHAILYDASPKAFILAIRGYQFDSFNEALSIEAENNLNASIKWIRDWLLN